MRKFILTILFLFLVSIASADVTIQKVEIAPLTGGVSFNTVAANPGWVTASSVIGRKEVLILNTSTTTNVYLTGVSGSTVYGTLYPRESTTFKAASSLNIYVRTPANSNANVEVWEIR